jgi:hypothetical protein
MSILFWRLSRKGTQAPVPDVLPPVSEPSGDEVGIKEVVVPVFCKSGQFRSAFVAHSLNTLSSRDPSMRGVVFSNHPLFMERIGPGAELTRVQKKSIVDAVGSSPVAVTVLSDGAAIIESAFKDSGVKPPVVLLSAVKLGEVGDLPDSVNDDLSYESVLTRVKTILGRGNSK